MLNNVFILTGYACNGKTSILPALKWNLELKFPGKKVILLDEHVNFGFDSIDIINNGKLKEQFKKSLDFRQSLFLSSAIAQFSLISKFIFDEDFIILSDRCILDVFLFTFIDKFTKDSFRNMIFSIEKNLVKKYSNINFSIVNDFIYFYLEPTKDPKVLENCFNTRERKETININDFYKKEEKFKSYYKFLVKNLTIFNHPSDNTYVLYKILDKITEKIEKRRS